MTYQLENIRSKTASVSIERLIKALGIEEARRVLNEVDEKAPSRMRYIDSHPLTKEEKVLLIELLKKESFNDMMKLLKCQKGVTHRKFAILTYRYLKNITIK